MTRPVALPRSRPEALELRDLLEANLQALQTLENEHRQMIEASLATLDAMCAGLRRELRAVASQRAPWAHALTQTRALLFVALQEIIVGGNGAELSRKMPRQGSQGGGSDEPRQGAQGGAGGPGNATPSGTGA